MENKIKVSVIMPVYNSGEYLQTAVDSILSQSLKDIELILVDDGSTDGSSEKCDEYAKKDKRVVVIHQKNGGICNARNAALKIARGEYIGFSDHDDEYLPGLLEDNYKLCITQNLDFVKFCKKWDIVEDGKVIERHSNTIAQKVFTRDDVVNNLVVLMKNRFCSCVWDTMFKRSFLRENNIWFDPFFKMGGEDYAFNFCCFEHVRRFGTNNKIYYYHIIRNKFSTSSKVNPKAIQVSQRFMENFIHLLNAYNINPIDMRSEYTFLYTMFYLSPQIQNVMLLYKDNNERIEKLKSFRLESFWFDFIDTTSLSFKQSTIYSIIHYLFKFKMYRTLFFIYKYLK